MRETKFIQQNQEKWEEFEQLMQQKTKDPDRLSALFVQITDDLSYSRTFYPNRSVRVYLNGLAQQLFYNLYGNKRSRESRFGFFWKEELPQIMFHYRKELLFSFLIFAVSVLIGILSSFMDPQFPAHILGDSYVKMTEENIASGDPMKVYKEANEIDMFMGITLNNLYVAFLTFILGLIAAIGTVGILISNGIMVGSFQWFFVQAGEFRESFLTIWVHGTLEISAIIIAGMAGLVMGKGLLFPGTYSRVQAFQVTAMHGLKIFFGIAPIIIAAGFIESFLTRFTEAPDIMRLLFILASLFFILGYFVIYPWLLARKGYKEPLKFSKVQPDNLQPFAYNQIRSNGELFLDTFTFVKRYASAIFKPIVAGSLLYTVLFYVFRSGHYSEVSDLLYFDEYLDYGNLLTYFDYNNDYFIALFNGLMTIVALSWVSYLFKKEKQVSENKEHITVAQFLKQHLLTIAVISILLNGLFFLPLGIDFLAIFLLAPIFMMWLFVSITEPDTNIFSGISRSVGLLSGAIFKAYGLVLILFSLGAVMYLTLESGLIDINLRYILHNFRSKDLDLNALTFSIQTFFRSFSLMSIFAFLIAGMSFLYYTLRETNDAATLLKRIPSIGERKKVYGVEAEF